MTPDNEQTLKQAIKDFLESGKMKGKLAEVNIIERWKDIVGPLIAKNTTKIYFRDGKLHLHIESAPLRHELQYSRSQLISLVNAEAGEDLIDDVIVR
jgi:predicted nucleic acid-binding Zn ribbon protein